MATAAKKSGRGGARPNSGPKPNPKTAEVRELKKELARVNREISKKAAPAARGIRSKVEQELSGITPEVAEERRRIAEEVLPISTSDPLEFLIKVMTEPLVPLELRLSAASKAVDFKHAKATAAPGKGGVEGKKQALAQQAADIADGDDDFGTAVPPAHLRMQ